MSGPGRDIPSKAQKMASSLYPRLLREKEAQGPAGRLEFWKQHLSHVDTLLGLTHQVTGKTLSSEAGLEQKRALKPCEGGRGVGAALLLFGPQDLADPIVLRAVGGSLKERDALWSSGKPGRWRIAPEGPPCGFWSQAAGPPTADGRDVAF